tara:strand:- start:1597 stop:2025 length:429 start_codon:yes stop_codon:yes gene_type:complete
MNTKKKIRMMLWGQVILLAVMLLFFVVGCSTFPKIPTGGSITNSLQESVVADSSNPCNPMLGLLGGFCLLGGMIMLVISRGTMGWRPLVGGVVFILINYALALYAHWFFIPVAIATGAISLAWAVKIVMKILKNEKIKEIKL